MNSLPPRTLLYIRTGAPEGRRNEELLAAAIQCRDARYTLGDAAGLLLPRAVADGLSHREAERTIRSAFGRAARAPLAGPALSFPRARPKLTPDQREQIEREKAKARLAAKAASNAGNILRENNCGSADYGNRSPENLVNGGSPP